MIIQNKHYFTTSLLASESKCNFRATNPALNCDLLCLKQVAGSRFFDGSGYLHGTTIHQQSCDLVTVPSLPRGRIVAGNFSTNNMSAVFSGLGGLVKVSLTIPL